MWSRAFLALVAWLPLAVAASNLVAVSTLPGFLCVNSQNSRCATSHPRQMPQSSLPTLLQHLSSRTTQSDLPLSETSTAPELVVVVTSPIIKDPTALVDRVSSAVNGASSFQAVTDRDASDSDLWELNARSISSVDKLASFASNDDGQVLKNGVSEVITVAAKENDEQLLHTLRALAERTSGRLAVVWTTREEKAPEDAAPADKPTDKDEEPQDQQTEKTKNGMNAPEINSAQLSGLLVALLFLIIFIPGFMCLWNIQPPQSFEIFDSNDMKKKIQ